MIFALIIKHWLSIFALSDYIYIYKTYIYINVNVYAMFVSVADFGSIGFDHFLL